LYTTNKEKLIFQQIVGRIAPPTLRSGGPSATIYVTTWNGKPSLGIGTGGIKYNVKMGDSCFGWPEAEYLTPGVSIEGIEERDSRGIEQSGAAAGLEGLSCIGNEVTMQDGEGKSAKGIVIGKGGSRSNIIAHFSDEDLEKLTIGDRIRVRAIGTGLKIKGFDGNLYSMSPTFLESLNIELKDDKLVIPVTREVPAYAMCMGVGGSAAMSGHWCIQSNPPELVEQLNIQNLRIGDLVACRDVLMAYGKGYYRGAVTVGVVAFGASEQAGHGPGVFAIASSKKGKILPHIDPEANLTKYLSLRR